MLGFAFALSNLKRMGMDVGFRIRSTQPQRMGMDVGFRIRSTQPTERLKFGVNYV